MTRHLRRNDNDQPWGADGGGVEVLQEELLRHGTRIEFTQADFANPDTPAFVVAAAARALDSVEMENVTLRDGLQCRMSRRKDFSP